ncbi:hypothetical protein PR202_ga12965 [Eleusine coracana subsp. coracana]|uniref:Uncharacterized protein n=1 Tax=Eleusine coracana subsp. coracana TaxID=191504 RepID=A0AAV5CDL0_ELECO|nr:hypothetical protein PR202_ga12965 [Eleusine coracana subsp. coracana]
MATVGKKMGGVPALGWWLMAVGTVRLVLAFSGYLDTASLGVATYANAESKLLTPSFALDPSDSMSQLWYGCCSSGTLTVMPVLPSNTDESLLSG